MKCLPRASRHATILALILLLSAHLAAECAAQARDGKAQLQRAQVESMPYLQDAAEQAFAAGVRDAIRATYRTIAEAMRHGDAGRIAGCYTPDAMLFPAGARPVQGSGAIERVYARTIGSGAAIRRVPIDVERHGDVAYEYGKLTVRGAGGDVVTAEPYVALWEKMRGGWKIRRDFVGGARP